MEWYSVACLGCFALGAEIGLGLATIVFPRHKLISALAGALLLLLVLFMAFAIYVQRTHNRIKADLQALPPANSGQLQNPPVVDQPGG